MKNNPIYHILAMNNFFDTAIKNLPPSFKFYYPTDIPNSVQLIQAIIATPWTSINAELINSLPNLKIICCFGTGIDCVDINAARNKNVIITNTPDLVTEDTADIAMTLLLCLARNIIFNDNYARSGKWKLSPPPLATSITGKTVGIIGLGKIGKRIAERAIVFGLNVIYYGKSKKNVIYTFYNDLYAMAKKCDFLIVSCPGGNETLNIVNLEVLKLLGAEGYLINISRGTTVNENDLILALEEKIIAGAGLDVYTKEPNIPEQLIKMEQVILLPHVGTATKETRKKMLDLVVKNIESFFKNNKPLTPVNI